MAQAGKITKGWIGLNATKEEVTALIEFYDFLVGSVGIEYLPGEWAETYRTAEKVINVLEEAV